MTEQAWHAPRLRPASIAIHDDAHMVGYTPEGSATSHGHGLAILNPSDGCNTKPCLHFHDFGLFVAADSIYLFNLAVGQALDFVTPMAQIVF